MVSSASAWELTLPKNLRFDDFFQTGQFHQAFIRVRLNDMLLRDCMVATYVMDGETWQLINVIKNFECRDKPNPFPSSFRGLKPKFSDKNEND